MGYTKNGAIEEMQAAGEKLASAAENGDTAGAREALEAGAWPETRLAGDPVIQGATLNGHVEIVKLLLEDGADANSSGTSGSTPLHRCIGTHTGPAHVEIVRMLLAAGADIGAADDTGHRAYDYVWRISATRTRETG
ncbi:MAG: Ankyrin repeats (3 copies) [Syntrophorhabdus sp. PtaB.Bin047]|nr:MAG: Ankyrin repeats (3 copies) [Syntrophorhabdus sp. PtaB.Bin047]